MPNVPGWEILVFRTVIEEEPLSRIPVRFGARISRPSTTMSVRPTRLNPNALAPASMTCPGPGFAPPMSTYSTLATLS